MGPALILVGTVAAPAAMFLPLFGFEGDSLSWWEATNGLDIALLLACVIAAGLALAVLAAGDPVVRNLSSIAGAVMFGIAFTPVPSAIDSSEGVRVGLWLVALAGGVALAGAVVNAVTAPKSRST
jgi:hypothetical protein